MARIPQNFINIGALLQGLGELSTIKKHLFRASREILLAVQSLLGVADNYVTSLASGSGNGQPLQTVLGYVQRTLNGLVKRLPHENEEDFSLLQEKVFSTILSVIDHEMMETAEGQSAQGQFARVKNPKAKMKQDVLAAIRDVLLKEMKKSKTRGPSHDDE